MPDRPYLFLELTNAVCSTCLRKVEAKIVEQDGRVFMHKRCPAHGFQVVLLSTDADYYRLCRRDAQAGANAAEVQHADQVRLPLRLRALPRPRAALVFDAGGGHGRLQPGVPDLLRRLVAEADRPAPAVGDCRGVVGRRGAERGGAGRGADQRRRADDPPAVLADPRRRQSPADQAFDAQHQRRQDRRRAGVWKAAGGLHAGLRAVPPVGQLQAGGARRNCAAAT